MKRFFNYLKALISLSLLGALVWVMKDKFSGIGGIFVSANKPLIFLCLFLLAGGIVMQAFRLKFLLDAQDVHLHINDVISLTFIGQFFNNFMPTSIGGDVVKAYYAAYGTKRKIETFASIVMDRLLGVATLVWISAAAVIIYSRKISNTGIVFAVFFLAVLFTLLIAAIFSKKTARRFSFLKGWFKRFGLDEKLKRLYEAANKYRRHKPLILYALLLSVLAQLVSIFMIFLLTVSISSKAPFLFLLLILPVISTISMLPSINGLGVREGGFVYFLGGMIGKEKAFVVSLMYLGLTLAASAVGGIIFLFKKEFKHLPH